MPTTLHAATIPTFLQIIAATAGLLDKAEAFCAERSLAPADLIDARIAEDMLPFAFQVKSVRTHSLGAIEGVRRGQFSPDRSEPPTSFDGLRDLLATARAGLEAVTVEEMESFVGRDTTFAFGEMRMDFVAEDFLMSFSQPNFFFHATTAYAILRSRGVPIGKRDFAGPVRMKAR